MKVVISHISLIKVRRTNGKACSPGSGERAGISGLVFFREQHTRRRTVGFGDDPDVRTAPERVRGYNPESLFNRQLVFGGVGFIDLAPIARNVAAEKLHRNLAGIGEGSERAGLWMFVRGSLSWCVFLLCFGTVEFLNSGSAGAQHQRYAMTNQQKHQRLR